MSTGSVIPAAAKSFLDTEATLCNGPTGKVRQPAVSVDFRVFSADTRIVARAQSVQVIYGL